MSKRFKWLICGAMVLITLAVCSRFLIDQVPGALAMQQSPAPVQSASESVLLVNADSPLPDGFVAADLVDLYGEKRSFKLATSDIQLTREAFEAANRMFRQAKQDGVDGFILTSGYRTEAEQRKLYEDTTDNTAAKPGASEHQTGLAFDVTAYRDAGGFEVTEQFRWLSEHCWGFGFILRYPEDKQDITGIPYEPWHYRYVGVQIAQEIREKGWVLEEYCERSSDLQ